VGDLLCDLFPNDLIFTEVRIPVLGLVFDYLVPSMSLAIECQGRQHDEYVAHFHGPRAGFASQQGRDRRKRELCELNGWTLREVAWGLSDSQIKAVLIGQ
jgi:hypothetical protein